MPVGKYAQAALTALGVWDAVRRAWPGPRTCAPPCCWWSAGEAPLGIVYATDAAASRGVRVVGTFPDATHPPITYPFALLANGRPRPRRGRCWRS